jgi:hypothetical protein
MSEPQRSSKPGATPGQEPAGGIADPATVEGGTLAPEDEAAASGQQSDPGGYPHEPSPKVPRTPAEDHPDS